MNGFPQTWEADFQLTAFGTILHFRRFPTFSSRNAFFPAGSWTVPIAIRTPFLSLVPAPTESARFDSFADGQTAAEAEVTWETLPGPLDQILHLAVAEFSPQPSSCMPASLCGTGPQF